MGESDESGRGEEERGREMKPWEQHSAVISIPRFDYRAPSSFLHNSLSAFLVTCPIKREKSATKEAMAIFEKIIKSYYTRTSECFENCDEIVGAKRRKVCDSKLDVDFSVSERNNDVKSAEVDEVPSSPTLKSDKDHSTRYNLSLVKLTRSGLLLLTVPDNGFPDITEVVSNIFLSLELGQLNSPSWCHRIFPIQATCCLNEKELQRVVSKLVVLFVNKYQDKLQQPIKFAIGYNRRGFEETEMKTSQKSSRDTEDLALLDRNKCFSAVARSIKDIVPDSVVDLKSPELSVLVEVLPVSGIPNGSIVVGVSVLPHNLVATKPRLSIKALLSETKTENKKQKIGSFIP